jgi:peptide/nickel transport system permease protein
MGRRCLPSAGMCREARNQQERQGSAFHGKFILPWITVAVGYAAVYARMLRSNMIETTQEDYIRTARAKGLSERRVVYKHSLRGALTPIVTMLGIDFGTILAGLVITENLFGLPGLGQLAVDSIASNDFPMVMGVTVIGSMFILSANIVVDVGYAFLDPRSGTEARATRRPNP